MKVDGGIGSGWTRPASRPPSWNAPGYSGAWTAETNHDPFLPLLLAAEHTRRSSWARRSPSPSPATR